jgi:hypothetical protein
MGSRGIVPVILNTNIKWILVIYFTPCPLYPHERTPVPIKQDTGWAPEPVWTFRRREKSLVFDGILLNGAQSLIS